MNILKNLSILALGLFSLAGCERKYSNDPRGIDQPRVEEPKTADRDLPPKHDELGVGGGPIALSNAVDKIADARCDREMKCGNVADGKKWVDRNACVADMKKSFGDELNTKDCPAGIDTKELNECVHAAANEDCKNPFDKLGRVAACRTSDMCRHVK